jgi:hypothetical protein
LHEHWRQQLERARYEAERLRRQYQAVEPENRLVARTLETNWEKSLQDLRRLEEEYQRFGATQPRVVSAIEQEQIRALAEDIPRLWHAGTTTIGDRRQIVRFLIERIVVEVQGDSERVTATIHWLGGNASRHELTRAVQSYEQLSDYAALWQRVRDLSDKGLSHADIARHLHEEGYRPPKRAERFTNLIVGNLLAKRGRSGPRPKALSARGLLKAGEWLLSDLARKLSMPSATLHRWRKAGWVGARKLGIAGGHWALWAPPKELQRLTNLRTHQESHSHAPIAAELTKPMSREKK